MPNYPIVSALTAIVALTSLTSQAATKYQFAGGTSFTPSVTRGATNQKIGEFTMTNPETSSGSFGFSAVAVQFNGTRTGLSNFKLHHTYPSDTVISDEVGNDTDPGDGNSLTFTYPSETLFNGWSLTYYISADVDSNATGDVTAVVPAASSLTLTAGWTPLNGASTPNNSPLSASSAALPVALSSFSME